MTESNDPPIPPSSVPSPGSGGPDPAGQGWKLTDEMIEERAGLLQTAYREITFSAVLLGICLGVVMNAAITYSGLKIGFTIGGSAIAAVLGFAVLKGVLRKGSIVETNIVQTIASAVGNSNAGVIFTLPALLMMGVKFNVWLMICACMAGGVLGVAFIVPARKQMIDLERLRFPSATAVAAILRAPGAGPAKALVLLMGVIISALVYLPTQLPLVQSRLEASQLGGDRVVEADQETQARWRGEDPLFAASHVFTLPQEEFDSLAEFPAPEPEAEDATESDPVGDDAGTNEGAEAADEPAVEDPDGDGLPETYFTRYASDEVRRTQMLAEWHESKTVPEEWVNRGRDQIKRIETTKAGKARAAELGVEWIAADDSIELGEEDKLAVLAARIQNAVDEGRAAPWNKLRSVNHWAAVPMPGYAAVARDAGLRGLVPRETEERDAQPGVEPPQEGLVLEAHDRVVTSGEMVDLGAFLGVPVIFGLLFAITPLSFGAGFLTGRAGLVVLGGGLLAFVFIAPLAFSPYEWIPPSTGFSDVSEVGRALITRPLGIGMLMGGAFLGIVSALPAMKAAFGGLLASKGGSGGHERDELSLKFLAFSVVASFGVLFAAAHFSESPDAGGLLSALDPWIRHAIVAAIGTGWIWFAGIIIAQCTGMTDWSPISGLALLTVLVIMVLTNEVVAAVMVGAALCVAISEAADMMGDLKTGYLVGAQPRRQQFMEILAVSIGPAVAIAVTIWLHKAFVLGGDDFPAPQGQALEAAIRGIQGEGLPYMLYGTGILLGVLLGLGSFAGLGVLVGLSMYLPVFYIYTYGLGCVANLVTEKIKGKEWTSEWCTPFFGGVIIGESVLGLIFAAIVVYQTS